jgi:hypothetical protein
MKRYRFKVSDINIRGDVLMKIPDMQALDYQYLLMYYRAKARLLQIKTLLATITEMERSNTLQENIHVVLRFDDATLD